MAAVHPPRKGAGSLFVADRLHSSAIRLLRRLRRVDDAMGLSAPRASALSVLVFGGPMGLTALAAAEQVRPPTMTRLVQALEREGLVRRRRDPADGRGVLLEATARGRAMLRAGRARRVAVLAGELGALPQRDQVALRRAIPAIERVAARLAPMDADAPGR